MSQKFSPSIIRIIQSDVAAMVGILIPTAVVILFVFVTVMGLFPEQSGYAIQQDPQGPVIFFYALIAGIVIGIPLTAWRVSVIQKLFERSLETPGKISGLSFSRDRGRVEFTYVFEGKNYTSGSSIMKNKRTERLLPGSQVTLMVDPQKPKNAMIRDLYT